MYDKNTNRMMGSFQEPPSKKPDKKYEERKGGQIEERTYACPICKRTSANKGKCIHCNVELKLIRDYEENPERQWHE
jgi:hypothetical protein